MDSWRCSGHAFWLLVLQMDMNFSYLGKDRKSSPGERVLIKVVPILHEPLLSESFLVTFVLLLQLTSLSPLIPFYC